MFAETRRTEGLHPKTAARSGKHVTWSPSLPLNVYRMHPCGFAEKKSYLIRQRHRGHPPCAQTGVRFQRRTNQDCAVRAAVPTGGLRGAAAWVNKELHFINEAAVRSSEISIALLSQAKKYLIL